MEMKLVEHGSDEPLRRVPISKLGNEKSTCISLFTGCGGAALGVRGAGFEVRVMVEWDKSAVSTLKANWTKAGHDAWIDERIAQIRAFETLYPNGHRGNYEKGEKWAGPNRKHEREALIATLEKRKASGWGRKGQKGSWWQKREPAIMSVDITKTTTAEILAAAELEVGEASLLEGGFPCQGFSIAGSRVIDDPRNALYRECVRVIREALPRAFMLENVPGLVSMAKGAIIKQICEDLAACGYDVSWEILNAADYGVPQNRKRVILVGTRNDVLSATEERIGLHMGAVVGEIAYPSWFTARYRELFQQKLFA